MVILTPDLLGNSFIGALIALVVTGLFELYQLYLNWKQAKVNNQMAELLKQTTELVKRVTCVQDLLKDFIDWRMR